jgi:hypothetical protein
MLKVSDFFKAENNKIIANAAEGDSVKNLLNKMVK